MKADLILVNGPIYSGMRSGPFSYLAVRENRILAIGRGSGRAHVGRNTEIIDLRGKAVVPGIIDSHLHLLDYAWSLQRINLEPCLTSHEVISQLKERAQNTVPGEWILGRGWRQDQFHGFPNKKLLDDIFPLHPVALNSRDGHFLWVNSVALKVSGLEKAVDVSGSYVGKNADGGPDGIFGESAVELMTPHISKPDAESRKCSLVAAQQKLHEFGIVGLHSTDGNQAFGDLQDLHRQSKLRLRIFHSIPLSQLDEAVKISLKSGFGDAWFRFGFVKIFSDGTLGSQSAWMLQPFHETNTTGIETISERELTEKIGVALKNGIAVGVHAIGDRAGRQVLNAFEANSPWTGVPCARSRIEHAQILNPEDIPRFRKIGVLASMQPHHAISDHEAALRYWGERSRYSYAWRSLQDSGAMLIFGSDAPVESPDPLQGMRAAVHRSNWEDRRQTISAINTLAAYTRNPAVASGEESERGTLEPGKLADFVIFSDDPIATEFQNTCVTGTAIDGKFVYRNFE